MENVNSSPWTMAQRYHLYILNPKSQKNSSCSMILVRQRQPCSSLSLFQGIAASQSVPSLPRLITSTHSHHQSRTIFTALSPSAAPPEEDSPLFTSLVSKTQEKESLTTFGSRALIRKADLLNESRLSSFYFLKRQIKM